MTDFFSDRVAIVTGAAHGIGIATALEFARQGAHVAAIDINPIDTHGLPILTFQGDLADPAVIEQFISLVAERYGAIHFIVNNAPPLFKGIDSCSYDDFILAQRVGVAAPFYLVKLALPLLRDGASIVNISSTRAHQSQPQSESYATAKGGIEALTHALAISLGPRARVNSIAPGWIDTGHTPPSDPADPLQQPVGFIAEPDSIVSMVMMLCSPAAAYITGQNLVIDGGMSRLMVYHNDNGWSYAPPAD